MLHIRRLLTFHISSMLCNIELKHVHFGFVNCPQAIKSTIGVEIRMVAYLRALSHCCGGVSANRYSRFFGPGRTQNQWYVGA